VPGAALGWLAGSLLRVRRRAVEAAMARARIASPHAAARAMYRALGEGVFELLWFAGASRARRDEALARTVVLDGALTVELERALARGPVVLAVSHTGNWEVVAAGAARWLARRGRGLGVVVKPLSMRGFDAFCTRFRRRAGLSLLPPRGALAEAGRLIARGDVLAMPIDQVPEEARHGVRAPFLGAPALVDRAPFVVAERSGATLLVVAAARRGWVQEVSLLASSRPSGDGAPFRESVVAAARHATAALDAFVRREPASWLWLHRRWKEPRGAPCRPLPSRLTNALP
jgi:KDO2-lipid IV(A) lauroyltransferase